MADSGTWFARFVDRSGKALTDVARFLGINHSQLSRFCSGERVPHYETAVDILASGRLSLRDEESHPVMDPRMFRPTVQACDPFPDGKLCTWEDVEAVAFEMEGLLQTLKAWRDGPETARRAVARAISMKGQQLSHIVRHLGGGGAGTGM